MTTPSPTAPIAAPEPATDVEVFFCQEPDPQPVERIDLPNPVELRQETILRLLQRGTTATTCAAIVRSDAALARHLFGRARADFYRQRNGRRGQILHDAETVDNAPDPASAESADPPMIQLELRLADAADLLGQPLLHEVVASMRAAQRARRRGTVPGPLRQKIYRLRARTGLPLRIELL